MWTSVRRVMERTRTLIAGSLTLWMLTLVSEEEREGRYRDRVGRDSREGRG